MYLVLILVLSCVCWYISIISAQGGRDKDYELQSSLGYMEGSCDTSPTPKILPLAYGKSSQPYLRKCVMKQEFPSWEQRMCHAWEVFVIKYKYLESFQFLILFLQDWKTGSRCHERDGRPSHCGPLCAEGGL